MTQREINVSILFHRKQPSSSTHINVLLKTVCVLTKTHHKLCISTASISTVHNWQPKLHIWLYVFVS